MPVLIRIDAWDPVEAAAVTLRAASHDDPAVCHADGALWWPVAAKLPSLKYDFFDGTFEGRITAPSSALTLRTEPWPEFGRYQLGDARIRISTGSAEAGWTLRFDGRVRAEPRTRDGAAEIDFAVDDRWLDKPLLATYAGTTGIEGVAAMKGQAKPLALGAPRFVPGKLIDPVNIVYQVSAGAIEAVEAAMEGLARLGAPYADYASYEALIAGDVAPGSWATCLTLGLVRLGAPPTRQMSFHVRGDNSGGWARKPGEIIRRLALRVASVTRIDATLLDALDVARPYNLSIYIDEQTTPREVIQSIAASVNAVAGVTWLGKLFVLPIAIGAPTLTLAADGSALPPVAGVTQLEAQVPWERLALAAERTYAVHALSDVAFTAELIEVGAYDSGTTYREGNIVTLPDGSRWLYIAEEPASGEAPAADSEYWSMLSGPVVLTDPNILMPADKLGWFSQAFETAEARHSALMTLSASLSWSTVIGAARDAANAARTDYLAFRSTITPPWDNFDVSSPMDREQYNEVYGAWVEALDALENICTFGAVAGTEVGGDGTPGSGLPAEEVSDATIVAGKTADELVAGGALTWRAQQKVGQEVSALGVRVEALANRAAVYGLGVSEVQAAYDALVALLTAASATFGQPDNPPVTVDNGEWLARKAAVEAAIVAMGAKLDATTVGLEPRTMADWEFVGVTLAGASGSGIGWGRTKASYLSPELSATLLKGDIYLGVRRSTDTMTADPANIDFGLRLRASDNKLRILTDGSDTAWPSGEAWPVGTSVKIKVYDFGQRVELRIDVPGAGETSVGLTGAPVGTQWVPVIILEDADSAFADLSLLARDPIPYTAVKGGPPANATHGANTVTPGGVGVGTGSQVLPATDGLPLPYMYRMSGYSDVMYFDATDGDLSRRVAIPQTDYVYMEVESITRSGATGDVDVRYIQYSAAGDPVYIVGEAQHLTIPTGPIGEKVKRSIVMARHPDAVTVWRTIAPNLGLSVIDIGLPWIEGRAYRSIDNAPVIEAVTRPENLFPNGQFKLAAGSPPKPLGVMTFVADTLAEAVADDFTADDSYFRFTVMFPEPAGLTVDNDGGAEPELEKVVMALFRASGAGAYRRILYSLSGEITKRYPLAVLRSAFYEYHGTAGGALPGGAEFVGPIAVAGRAVAANRRTWLGDLDPAPVAGTGALVGDAATTHVSLGVMIYGISRMDLAELFAGIVFRDGVAEPSIVDLTKRDYAATPRQYLDQYGTPNWQGADGEKNISAFAGLTSATETFVLETRPPQIVPGTMVDAYSGAECNLVNPSLDWSVIEATLVQVAHTAEGDWSRIGTLPANSWGAWVMGITTANPVVIGKESGGASVGIVLDGGAPATLLAIEAATNAEPGSKLGTVAPNAGSSGVWKPIGTGMTVTGNSLVKDGGTHGVWDGAIVGLAATAGAYVGGSIINAGFDHGWVTVFALDDDATTFDFDTDIKYGLYVATTVVSGVSAFMRTPATGFVHLGVFSGIDADSRARLIYDNGQIYAELNGQVISPKYVVPSGQKLWPKVLTPHRNGDYADTAIYVIRDIQAGPYTDNAWDSIVGENKAAAKATADNGLVAWRGAAAMKIEGNTVSKLSDAPPNWDNLVTTVRQIAGAQRVSFTLPASTESTMVGLTDDRSLSDEGALYQYAALDFAVYRWASSEWQIYEDGDYVVSLGTSHGGVTFGNDTRWEVRYDEAEVTYWADDALMYTSVKAGITRGMSFYAATAIYSGTIEKLIHAPLGDVTANNVPELLPIADQVVPTNYDTRAILIDSGTPMRFQPQLFIGGVNRTQDADATMAVTAGITATIDNTATPARGEVVVSDMTEAAGLIIVKFLYKGRYYSQSIPIRWNMWREAGLTWDNVRAEYNPGASTSYVPVTAPFNPGIILGDELDTYLDVDAFVSASAVASADNGVTPLAYLQKLVSGTWSDVAALSLISGTARDYVVNGQRFKDVAHLRCEALVRDWSVNPYPTYSGFRVVMKTPDANVPLEIIMVKATARAVAG